MALKQTNEGTNEYALTDQQVVYQIAGFDRPSFVSDVTSAVPQQNTCRITSLSFEADGVLVNGQLVVEVVDQQLLVHIERELRSVRGLVSVKQTNEIQAERNESTRSLNPYARAFFLIWGVVLLGALGLRTNAASETNTIKTEDFRSEILSQNKPEAIRSLQYNWFK